MKAYQSAAFRAMGTEVEVLAAPALPAETLDTVRGHFETIEAALSRFRPESELSRLNAAAGTPFRASPLLREVLREAIAASGDSGGIFNPLVLRAVEAAGYSAPFDRMGGVAVQAPPVAAPPAGDITIDGEFVTLPAGSGLDLGGFAKGWAVDRVAPLMACCGSWLVNAGGDLLARGPGLDGDGWTVGVEDPFAPGLDVARLRLRDRATATSSTMRRRWTTQDGFAHHLVDPRTGAPADTGLASVTVIAATVAEAEVTAKAILIAGREDADFRGLRADSRGYIKNNPRKIRANPRPLAALLVHRDATVTMTPTMGAYLV